jgi:putative solute:sodium symporter small subunit
MQSCNPDDAVWFPDNRGAAALRQIESSFSEKETGGGIMTVEESGKAYWQAVLGLITKVLVIWFLVSYGAGILFAPVLNNIHLGGYPLGFFFAHQGSIYVFVALIFWYAKKMDAIDRQFDVHED